MGAIPQSYVETASFTTTGSPPNAAPNARAGSDQSVSGGATVTLSGSGSSDSDGSIASYAWSQTSGTTVALSGASTVTATFTAPSGTHTLIFRLTVTDNDGATDTDTVTVSVVNSAPSAAAGNNQSVAAGASVTLSGSGSSDSDGTIASYAWTQSSGTTVTLSGADTVTATFTAPVTSGTHTLVFLLTVTDDGGSAASDQVTISVAAQATLLLAIEARSVGPDRIQIILTGQNVSSGASVSYRYRVSPSGSWITGTATWSSGVTTTLTGAVVGTEYDFQAVLGSFPGSGAVTTTHTHVGTTLFMFNLKNKFTANAAVDLWEVADISAVSASDTNRGSLSPGPNDARAAEAHGGWFYVAHTYNRSIWRSRTPATLSSWTNMGTMPSNAGGIATLFEYDGALWGMHNTFMWRIPDPTDPTVIADRQRVATNILEARGVWMDGTTLYVWDHNGTKFCTVDMLNVPGASADAPCVTVSGSLDIRASTVFNGRLIAIEEAQKKVLEIILNAAGTAPTILNLGNYDSSVPYVNAAGSWDPALAAVVVSAVAEKDISATSATVTLTLTGPVEATDTAYVRYRIGSTGNYTSATATGQAGTTVDVVLTGLVGASAYEYEASLDAGYIADATEAGTFTTLTQLGQVSTPTLSPDTTGDGSAVWTAVANATSYRIQWATTSAALSATNEATPSGTSYALTGLDAAQIYYVRVRAEAGAAYVPGDWSTIGSFTTTIAAPTNLATTFTTTTITATWDAVSRATRYDLVHRLRSVDNRTTVSVTTNTATVTGLVTDTVYEIRVRAAIGSTSGRFTGWLEVTPAAPATPDAPTGLVLTPGLESITAEWTAPVNTNRAALSSYQLEHRAKGAPAWIATTVSGGSTTTYSIASLVAGTTYQVRVAATNADGTGPHSDVAEGIAEGPPDAPTSIGSRVYMAADPTTLTSMEIYWTAPGDNGASIEGYDLQYRLKGAALWTDATPTVSIYTATGLTLHSTYEARVLARNAHGDSPYSEVIDLRFVPKRMYLVSAPTSSYGSQLYRWSGSLPVLLSARDGIFGSSSINDAADIAVLDGKLFVIRSGSSNLYEVDLATNLASKVCTFSVTGGQPTGLTNLAGGFVLNAGGHIYSMDTACSTTSIGNTAIADIGALATIDGIVYATRIATGSLVYIYTIDTSNGSPTVFASSNHGQASALAGNGYRLYIPGYGVSGSLYHLSTRSLRLGLEGTASYGTVALSAASGAAIIDMEQAGPVTDVVLGSATTSLTVTWNAPSVTGTGVITGYSLQYKAASSTTWLDWTHADTSTSATITGLQTGTSYNVRVATLNIAGTGEYTSETASTGATVPGEPLALTATPSSGKLTVTWDAPASNGGTVITAYAVWYRLSSSVQYLLWSNTSSATTAVITGLTNGSSYDVTVAATNAQGTGTYAFTTGTPAVVLQIPGNVAATPSPTTIDLTWGAVTDATGYTVEWASAADTHTTLSGTSSTAAYQITGLTEGTEYFVRVKATASGLVDSGWSTPISSTTTVSPLTQVVGLSVSASSISSIDAAWTLVTSAESYVVQWRVASGSYTLQNQVIVLTNSAAITGLASGTGYQVRVAAQKTGTNNGAWSSNEYAPTSSIGQVGGVQTDADHEEIVVTWTLVSGAATYVVQWRTASGSYSQTNEATVTAATHTITGLSEGVDYALRVRADPPLGAAGAWSTEATVTTDLEPPARVTGLALAVNSQTQITATWTASARADRYLVQWVPTGVGWASGSDATVSTNRAVLTGLTLGTTYYVRVTSIRTGATNGSPSVPESASTSAVVLQTPANVAATPSPTTVALTWGAVTDATGYVVEWKTSAGAYGAQSRGTPSAASYTIIGLTEGTTYLVRVKATASGVVDSGWSTPVSTTTTISPLPQVTGLSLVASSISSIDATWTIVTGAESYVVQWRVSGGSYTLQKRVIVTTNSAAIIGLGVRDRLPCEGGGTEGRNCRWGVVGMASPRVHVEHRAGERCSDRCEP